MIDRKPTLNHKSSGHILFKGLLFSFILISHGHAADNPCGVSCTQTIANNTSASAINQANNYTDNEINTRVYEKIVIFAENTANITTGGGNQWAFGDGDTGAIGIPVAEDWELFAISFQARSVTAATTVTMFVRNMNDASNLYTFTAPLAITPPSASGVYTELLANPVPIPAGTTIGFVTSAVSAGAVTGARVAAWLRRHPD
ncbi:hypothetical protein [Legionella sp. W05-934-2]|jgi:hypothetical protein|uniref:hypothetical protein n=1 Tax=Legionella sp. W05-934-2 TaxID=1198649 RepID=UPI003461E9F8